MHAMLPFGLQQQEHFLTFYEQLNDVMCFKQE